jgi:formylglycine-generating enzyme
MSQPIGWRRYVVAGLACAVAISGVLFLIDRIRKAFPPPAVAPLVQHGPVALILEGAPMQIDPAELASAGLVHNDNGLGIPFCWCPPGSFHMGHLPHELRRFSGTDPVRVTLRRGFWMGKFEVTQSQWQLLMGVNLRQQRARDPDQPRPEGEGTLRDHVGEGAEYPIYYVSHIEAEEFCRRLTEAERAAGRLEAGWEYRLPTEAQWEFACRAGTTTATAFGDGLSSSQANFDGSKPFNRAPAGPYPGETTPVGSYKANAWGLHDMHGNVWEWCRDGFVKSPAGGIDPLEEPSSGRRTFRGGCWHNPGVLCISTSRAWGEVNDRGSGLGFRAALVPAGP